MSGCIKRSVISNYAESPYTILPGRNRQKMVVFPKSLYFGLEVHKLIILMERMVNKINVCFRKNRLPMVTLNFSHILHSCSQAGCSLVTEIPADNIKEIILDYFW